MDSLVRLIPEINNMAKEKKLQEDRVNALIAWLKEVDASQVLIKRVKKVGGSDEWEVNLSFEEERLTIKG